ncbi:sensor domain-containing diguanylate cyclase [Terriglobus roseus]|uniref:sensor domain-containing diguanylate cyclase n=1 Tax=Terriglobus roseus TaxID=392734 RepID=UPI00145E1106|nr:sensor domain-containing diguanylate cyclase [Terriglobus roseus]
MLIRMESSFQTDLRRFDTLTSGKLLTLEQQILLIEDVHRYGRIFDAISNGITIGDAAQPGAPLLYVNSAFEEMTGYRSNEVLGRDCNFLQRNNRDQPGVVKIRKALEERREERVLLRNYRKDGTPFWNELYLSPILDLKGRLTHFVGIQNDVTARVNAELQLSDERDRLFAASECSLDCIYVCESVRDKKDDIVDFTFTYLNANVSKMVLVPLDKLLGGRMCELLPVNRELGLFDLYKQVALTGVPLVHECRVHDRNIRSSWIRVQVVKLHDGVVVNASDITQRKEAEELMLSHGLHDSLTSLPNRRVLKDRIQQGIFRADRTRQLMSVFVIDLDNFKQINDTLGHAAGDETLVTVARRLSGCMRSIDSVIRMGGDEFVIVLPEIRGVGDTEMLAARISRELAAPMIIAGQTVQVTSSIGITLYPGTALTPDDLLSEADGAMYAAKRRGKNQSELFVPKAAA